MSQFNCICCKQIFSCLVTLKYTKQPLWEYFESIWLVFGERFPITLTLLGSLYKYVVVICSTRVLRANFGQKSDSIGIFRYVTDAFFDAPSAAHSPYLHTPDCTKYLMAGHSQHVTKWFLSSMFVRYLLARHDTATRRERNTEICQFIIFHFLTRTHNTAMTELMATNYSDCVLLSLL